MYQPDRGTYKKQDTFGHAFTHSCLGRFVIAAVILAVLAIIAALTVPSERVMKEEMTDNIRQCIETNDSLPGDWLDDAVHNIGYIFTHADQNTDNRLMEAFHKYNRLEYYKHGLYSTTYIHNNFRPDGVRCGIGLFGIVIPTVNFNDFLLRVGPMHKGYGKRIIQTIRYDDDYMGINPNVREYHYKGNPDD